MYSWYREKMTESVYEVVYIYPEKITWDYKISRDYDTISLVKEK